MHIVKLLATVALATFSLGVAAQQGNSDDVIFFGSSDPEMNAAIKQAQDSLPAFLKLAANPLPGTNDYKLKVKVTDNGNIEHFWVAPFTIFPGGFSGILVNEPQTVTNVALGQEIFFDKSRISDWGYRKNGREVGSFTVCVMLKKMPAEQVEYYQKNYGFDC